MQCRTTYHHLSNTSHEGLNSKPTTSLHKPNTKTLLNINPMSNNLARATTPTHTMEPIFKGIHTCSYECRRSQGNNSQRATKKGTRAIVRSKPPPKSLHAGGANNKEGRAIMKTQYNTTTPLKSQIYHFVWCKPRCIVGGCFSRAWRQLPPPKSTLQPQYQSSSRSWKVHKVAHHAKFQFQQKNWSLKCGLGTPFMKL